MIAESFDSNFMQLWSAQGLSDMITWMSSLLGRNTEHDDSKELPVAM